MQQAIRDEIELQPSRYLLRELSEIWVGVPRAERRACVTAAAEVAAFFGARGEDLVFVDNATSANAVLRLLPLAPGDADPGDLARLRRGRRWRRATLRASAGAVVVGGDPATTERPEAVVEAIDAALGARTRLVVVDHIASDSALLLPVAEVAARCRARDVPVLRRRAHAPGAIALDLPSIGADWYVGNLHKWPGHRAARPSCGVRRNARRCCIRRSSPGGSTRVHDRVRPRRHARSVALAGARRRRSSFSPSSGPRRCGLQPRPRLPGRQRPGEALGDRVPNATSMVASMVSVPLPARFGGSAADAARLRDLLLFEDRIELDIAARGDWLAAASRSRSTTTSPTSIA